MKSWNYSQITKNTENQIIAFMEDADKANDAEACKQFQNWAYGAYLAWSRLTMGWMVDGDAARLEALTKRQSDKD